MVLDLVTKGRWRAEHGMVLTKLADRDVFVALVELPVSRGRDPKEVLREQDANALLMSRAKEMYALLEQAEKQLTLQTQPEWSLVDAIRMLRASVNAPLT